jgi:hypothetical protein
MERLFESGNVGKRRNWNWDRDTLTGQKKIREKLFEHRTLCIKLFINILQEFMGKRTRSWTEKSVGEQRTAEIC